jgi:hypothetical protein
MLGGINMFAKDGMFLSSVDGKVYFQDIKIGSKAYIIEADELDHEITFETWFEEVDDDMSSGDVVVFEDKYNEEWAPSTFRRILVEYAKEE